jgi:hypothetical protein
MPEITKPRRSHGKARLKPIAAQKLVVGGTVKSVAAEMKINIQTLWRWQRDPEFKLMMQQARAELLQHTTNALVTASLNAVKELHEIATDPNANEYARVAASVKLLEYSYKAGIVEKTLEEVAGEVDYLSPKEDVGTLPWEEKPTQKALLPPWEN